METGGDSPWQPDTLRDVAGSSYSRLDGGGSSCVFTLIHLRVFPSIQLIWLTRILHSLHVERKRSFSKSTQPNLRDVSFGQTWHEALQRIRSVCNITWVHTDNSLSVHSHDKQLTSLLRLIMRSSVCKHDQVKLIWLRRYGLTSLWAGTHLFQGVVIASVG